MSCTVRHKMARRKMYWTAIIILLAYDIYYFTTPKSVYLKDPKFTLLGPYNKTDYPSEDVYNQLIDIKNFSFELNSNLCAPESSGLLLIIIVTSNPVNVVNRLIIRNTWGKNTRTSKTVFLVGESKNQNVTRRIYNESVLYGDIVQGTFQDAYRNMTYKHVMGLKWITHYCRNAKYILKSDDDTVTNIVGLKQFLTRELSPWGAKDLIACHVLKKAPVQRGPRYKWSVSLEEYDRPYYPDYCAGWFVIYSQDVVHRLLKRAQAAPFFWIDDVHITGVIAQELGIPRTGLDLLILTEYRTKLLVDFGFKYAGKFLFSPPDLPVERIMKIWKAIPKSDVDD